MRKSKTHSKAHSSVANAQRARLSRAHRVHVLRRNRNSLSLFRQLTHSPDLRAFHENRILRQREATKGVALTPFSFVRLANQAESFQSRVCRARKERRQVLFAKGKAGGAHKPPRYNILSRVRC